MHPVRAAEASVPEIYRMDSAAFNYEMEPQLGGNGVRRFKVRFPSPVVTKHPENNTVHGELFLPQRQGPHPCVIMLHIAGGDFPLSRFVSSTLAYSGTAALFIKLPYYGERRPPGGKVRMISPDLERGLGSMRQAVLDLRRACDWIQSRPELDHKRIGVMGISLGAIVGGLASAIEPRLDHACLVMGGAELEHILFGSSEREAKVYSAAWKKAGGTRESFAAAIRPFDASAYGDRLKERIVLLIGASDDEVIPRPSRDALWKATGCQKCVWYPCGHYSMVRYLIPAFNDAVVFFKAWPSKRTFDAGAAGVK